MLFQHSQKEERKDKLLGEWDPENWFKVAPGLKKDFARPFNKAKNGGLGDKAGWQVRN